MQEYLNILGYEVEDLVTKIEGIATSISFDLYGCVQVSVISNDSSVKKADDKWIGWYDFKRLVKKSETPVMDQPTFEIINGPAFKGQPQ